MAVTLNGSWEASPGLQPHVREAKKRGLSCGTSFVRETPPTKQPSQQTPSAGGDEFLAASSGSGFAVSKVGHVVTNHHVIDGCQRVFIHDGRQQLAAHIVAKDSTSDLAILKADFTPQHIFSLSDEKPEILQDVFVAGYPFGMEISSSVKVTKGIVSSLTGIADNFARLQIDAAIQPGNSGGPIIDLKGNIVGVAVAKLDLKAVMKAFGVVPEGTNFGVKSSVLNNMLDSLSIETKTPNKEFIPKSQIAKQIEKGTYYLSCWMDMAQIERLRATKVMFENIK